MLNSLNFSFVLMIIVMYPDKADAIGPFDSTAMTIVLLMLFLVSLVGIILCRLLTSIHQQKARESQGLAKVKNHSCIPSNWTEADIRSYLLGRTFEQQFPPKDPDITSDQFSLIDEKGVDAWEMEKHPYMNVLISENTEITFLEGDCCVQSNLPFPQGADVGYFEVKIHEKPADTIVAIGVASKPYPSWRFPGLNKHSVGYYSTGHAFCNDSFEGKVYGALYHEGDVIGCGYQTRSGSVFFTRNGEKMKSAVNGFHYGIYPSIAANGPCTLHINFGQFSFVLLEANVKKWGFGPVLETRPPPAYGIAENMQTLESESDYNEEELSFLRIPRRYWNYGRTDPSSRNVSRNSLSFLSEFSISIFDESCDQTSQPGMSSTGVTPLSPPPPAYPSGRVD